MAFQHLGLTYHYVRNQCNRFPGIHPLSYGQFTSHVDYFLTCLDYQPLALDRSFTEINLLCEPHYIFTFDDGLKEHLAVAEYLSSQNIQAFFFVIGSTLPSESQRVPLVHLVHWCRSFYGDSFISNILVDLLPDENSDLLLRAQQMHIHDSPSAALLKYSINFLLNPVRLYERLEELLLDHFGSHSDFCSQFFLSPQDIRKIYDLGHTIGWHSKTHLPLSKFTESELLADIAYGYSLLTGLGVLAFRDYHLSYPYGRHDAIPFDYLESINSSPVSFAWTLGDLRTEHTSFHNLLLPRITPNEFSAFQDLI